MSPLAAHSHKRPVRAAFTAEDMLEQNMVYYNIEDYTAIYTTKHWIILLYAICNHVLHNFVIYCIEKLTTTKHDRQVKRRPAAMPSESQVSASAARGHCRRPPWWKRISQWRITVLGQTGAAAGKETSCLKAPTCNPRNQPLHAACAKFEGTAANRSSPASKPRVTASGIRLRAALPNLPALRRIEQLVVINMNEPQWLGLLMYAGVCIQSIL